MSDLDNRLLELLRRTKLTTKSRYRASERLELHHKISQWTVSSVSVALVFIPLSQALNVPSGIDLIYLSATQATLAILVLVYSLLLGQENFISRSQAMHRNGVELGRFARKLAGLGSSVSDVEYANLTEEYYDILEKYENHKPIDYLHTLLSETPKGNIRELLTYVSRWTKAKFIEITNFSHYFIVLFFVAFIFMKLFSGIASQHG